MTTLFLMSSSHAHALDIGEQISRAVGWPLVDARLPLPTDPARDAAWMDVCELLSGRDEGLIVTAPILSGAEVRALGRTIELVWLKLPHEHDRVPLPGTLVIDASMPADSIASTICAVLQLSSAARS